MDLHYLAENFRKIILPVLILLLIGVFVVNGIFNIVTLIQTVQDERQPALADLVVTESGFNDIATTLNPVVTKQQIDALPKTVSTFEATFGLTDRQLADLASKVGIGGTAVNQGGSRVWQTSNKLLKYETDLNQVVFNTLVEPQEKITVLDKKEWENRARAAVKLLAIGNSSLVIKDVIFLSGDYEPVETDFVQATSVQVVFYWQAGDSYDIKENKLSLGAQGNILHFAIFPVQVGGKKETYSRKGYDELLADFRLQRVRVVGVKSINPVGVNPLEQVALTEFKLGYYSQPNTKLLQPVYLFQGNVGLQNQQLTIEAITPAIKGVQIAK